MPTTFSRELNEKLKAVIAECESEGVSIAAAGIHLIGFGAATVAKIQGPHAVSKLLLHLNQTVLKKATN